MSNSNLHENPLSQVIGNSIPEITDGIGIIINLGGLTIAMICTMWYEQWKKLEKSETRDITTIIVNQDLEDNWTCIELDNIDVRLMPTLLVYFVDETDSSTRTIIDIRTQLFIMPSYMSVIWNESFAINYTLSTMYYFSEIGVRTDLDSSIIILEERLIYNLRLLRKMESFYLYYDFSYNRLPLFRFYETD